MKISPEEMADRLEKALGEELVSVVLYGSAAGGDHGGRRSDYNLLVVTRDLGVALLRRVAPLVGPWVKAGNPPPLFFTEARLRASADVFALEIADIRDNHRVLWGRNPLEGIEPDAGHLCWELERELKGKLIQLRERFLVGGGKPKEVERLLIASLSTFLVLFKNTLRLFESGPPPRMKLEACRRLRTYLDFDLEALEVVAALKEERKPEGYDPLVLFGRYLAAVERVVDGVDGWLHSKRES